MLSQIRLCPWLLALALVVRCATASDLFPPELVSWSPRGSEPIFAGRGPGHWDAALRERGWILREPDGTWRMWYTGYDGTREGTKLLGLATSSDGLRWQRHGDRPLYDQGWVEDMMVVRHDGRYLMFAEGLHDQAQWLTSADGVRWNRQGTLTIQRADGQPFEPGPFGTPVAWHEAGRWRLLYERRDQGIWLAESADLRAWTNVQDEPVMVPGPGAYDRAMIAVNQVVRRGAHYYAFYHGRGEARDSWCSCLAVSDDLRQWTKYPGNPLIAGNQSSPQLVECDGQLRLYTMHGQVRVYEPDGAAKPRAP